MITTAHLPPTIFYVSPHTMEKEIFLSGNQGAGYTNAPISEESI
jgi:hypothetical protein